MKKVLLIYNPIAGVRNISNKLDYIIEFFANHSQLVLPYRIDFTNVEPLLYILNNETPDTIIIAGGDGTVNFIVNLMLVHNIKIPLGFIPGGTCNDLSRCLGLPGRLKPALKKIIDNDIKQIDVGLINKNHYFLSSFAGGIFVDVSFNTSSELKKSLGPLAYYLKALVELPSIKSFDLKVVANEACIEDRFYLFLILNGVHAAGFNNLLKCADISDGYMDLILVKECPHFELAGLLFNTLKNDILRNKNVLHIRTKNCIIQGEGNIPITVDGQEFQKMPFEIEFKNKILEVLC